MIKKIISIVLSIVLISMFCSCSNSNNTVTQYTLEQMNSFAKVLEASRVDYDNKVKRDIEAFENIPETYDSGEDLAEDTEIDYFSTKLNGKDFFNADNYQDVFDDLNYGFNDSINYDNFSSDLYNLFNKIYRSFANINDLCKEYNIEYEDGIFENVIDNTIYCIIYGIEIPNDTIDTPDTLSLEPHIFVANANNPSVIGLKLSGDTPVCLIIDYETTEFSPELLTIDENFDTNNISNVKSSLNSAKMCTFNEYLIIISEYTTAFIEALQSYSNSTDTDYYYDENGQLINTD